MAETDAIDNAVFAFMSVLIMVRANQQEESMIGNCDSRRVNPGLIDGENLKQYSKNQIRRRGQICVERFLKKVPPFHVVSMITDNKDSLPGLFNVLYCTIMYCTEEYGTVKYFFMYYIKLYCTVQYCTVQHCTFICSVPTMPFYKCLSEEMF